MSFAAFDTGILATKTQNQRQHEAEQRRREQQDEQHRELLERWKESEHRLNILRSIQRSSDQPEEERMRRWIETVIEQK